MPIDSKELYVFCFPIVMKEGDCLGITAVKQAAEKLGTTPRRVQEIIRTGRVEGIQK